MIDESAFIETSLARFAPSTAALAALCAAVSGIMDFGRGQVLLAEGESSGMVSLLCKGIAKSYRALADGHAQTLALFVAGDLLDADAFLLGRASATVSAITSVRIALIPHVAFKQAMEQRPEIGWALLRSMARDRAMLQEWLTGLGRRPAHARTTHLICEISTRMGGGARGRTDIPLSQVELADLLGLSAVHVNRVLQQLRAEGLIDVARGRLMILDPARLKAIAGFDAAYLTGES